MGSGIPARCAIVLVAVALFLFSATAEAAPIFFTDGGTHTVGYPIDAVLVDDGPGPSTTEVNIVTGAFLFDTVFPDTGLVAFGSSIIRMSGGTIVQDYVGLDSTQMYFSGGSILDDLIVDFDAKVFFSGGSVTDEVTFFGNSMGSITGGDLLNDLNADEDATVQVFGGTVGDDVESKGNAIVEIFGGTFTQDLEASDEGQIDIYGGSIGVGGTFDTGISAVDEGVINLFGPEFFVDGVPVGFGKVLALSGDLSGTLSDGTPFLMPFEQLDDGVINLNFQAVPEPSSAALLTLGGLLVLRRRKRDRTAA